MRYLLTLIMALFLAVPAFANSNMCSINGPHNCVEDSEARLQSLTINTIHHMEFSREHAFKTENDRILENYTRNHAQLSAQVPSSPYLFLNK